MSTGQRCGVAGLCVLALAGSALLAWWQWTRFESGSGSIQNLGYMLQWPLFGLFPAFLVWRVHRLTRGRRPDETRAAPETAESAPPPRKLGYVAPTAPAEEPDDPTLAAYNRYLAELNEHQEGQR